MLVTDTGAIRYEDATRWDGDPMASVNLPLLDPQKKQRPGVSIGFTCVCGERVTVYRLVTGKRNVLPPSMTAACCNGHVAVFLPEQFGCLEDWIAD